MLPIDTILHPTDFSEHSQHAFHLAFALARDHGARLIVLHVAIRPTIVYGEGIVPVDPEGVFQEEKERLRHVGAERSDVRIEHCLEEGDPVTEILRVAQESNVDLIVMGTHGRRGLRRLLMGSVAEQVVRKSMCPVLTVKTPFPARSSVGRSVAELSPVEAK